MTEAELLTECLILAAANDVLAFHDYDSRTSAGDGFPDLVLAGVHGVMFAELKSAAGSTRPAQSRWKWRIIASLGQFGYARWTPRELNNGQIERCIQSLNMGAARVSA